jgi:hypothetical protein
VRLRRRGSDAQRQRLGHVRLRRKGSDAQRLRHLLPTKNGTDALGGRAQGAQ